MRRNMGRVDRLLRAFVIAPVLIVLSASVFGVGTVLGIVALVFSGVMLVTSAVGFCPPTRRLASPPAAASPPRVTSALAGGLGSCNSTSKRARAARSASGGGRKCDGS